MSSYPISHWSVSSLNLFNSCRWCWHHKYITKKIPDVTHEFFEFGKKYHKEVNNYHIRSDYDKDLIAPYTQRYPQDYRQKSEVKFRTLLPGIDLPILGFVDGITSIGICDLKTGNTKPPTTNNPQVILYSKVYHISRKKWPVFEFNHVNKKGVVKHLVCQSNEKEYKQLREKKILPFLKQIKDGNYDMDGVRYATHMFGGCPFS